MSLDEVSAVILAMRVIAFCIGAALLISGVIDLANATQQQIFPSISTGAIGFCKDPCRVNSNGIRYRSIVGEDIVVELKVNLTRSKADRLVGQIERFPFPNIIIVACGIKDENAWEELND